MSISKDDPTTERKIRRMLTYTPSAEECNDIKEAWDDLTEIMENKSSQEGPNTPTTSERCDRKDYINVIRSIPTPGSSFDRNNKSGSKLLEYKSLNCDNDGSRFAYKKKNETSTQGIPHHNKISKGVHS